VNAVFEALKVGTVDGRMVLDFGLRPKTQRAPSLSASV
jgi:hypothetical protein